MKEVALDPFAVTQTRAPCAVLLVASLRVTTSAWICCSYFNTSNHPGVPNGEKKIPQRIISHLSSLREYTWICIHTKCNPRQMDLHVFSCDLSKAITKWHLNYSTQHAVFEDTNQSFHLIGKDTALICLPEASFKDKKILQWRLPDKTLYMVCKLDSIIFDSANNIKLHDSYDDMGIRGWGSREHPNNGWEAPPNKQWP